MPRTTIDIDAALVAALDRSLERSGHAEIDGLMREGSLPDLVAHVEGLSVHIYADEHPPPHFCVRYQGRSANYSIVNCEPLDGHDTWSKRHDRSIRRWWKKNRDVLISTWNRTRPSDCPVGPVRL
jgi:hypothetical protein